MIFDFDPEEIQLVREALVCKARETGIGIKDIKIQIQNEEIKIDVGNKFIDKLSKKYEKLTKLSRKITENEILTK